MRSKERLIEVLKTVNPDAVEGWALLSRAAFRLGSTHYYDEGELADRLADLANQSFTSEHIRELCAESIYYLECRRPT